VDKISTPKTTFIVYCVLIFRVFICGTILKLLVYCFGHT